MPEAKKLEALTDWIAYELQPTEFLGDPHIKLKLRYVDRLDVTETMHAKGWSFIKASREIAMMAVAEWDLTKSGKPIPVNDETKQEYLWHLLAEQLVITDEDREKAKERETEPIGTTLAIAIMKDAQNRSLFLKN